MRVPLLLVRPTAGGAVGSSSSSDLSVRITSPVGRIGTPGTIRIVAQVRTGPTATIQPLRFFVDGVLVGTAETGPPYAVPWVDDNPFLRHEIVVQAYDSDGRTAEDKVVLEPYEIKDEAHVNSVRVEASVYDKKGRYVKNLDASRFLLREDGVPQKLDMVAPQSIPATFALLVDASQSMTYGSVGTGDARWTKLDHATAIAASNARSEISGLTWTPLGHRSCPSPRRRLTRPEAL